jgi:hypothetical protein
MMQKKGKHESEVKFTFKELLGYLFPDSEPDTLHSFEEGIIVFKHTSHLIQHKKP